jgi:putative redox protein
VASSRCWTSNPRTVVKEVAGCVSNDLFREARAEGIELERVRVTVRGDFRGDPPVSTDVVYDLELTGEAPRKRLEELVSRVDDIAEIPNSLRQGTSVRLGTLRLAEASG